MRKFLKYSSLFLFIANTTNSQTPSTVDSLNTSLENKIRYEDIYNTINYKLKRSLLGVEVPYFIVKDIEGKEFDSSKTKRLVIYNFWFGACVACYGEVEILNELHDRFQEEVDFVSITFDSKEDVAKYNLKNPSKSRQISVSRYFIDKLGMSIGYPTTLLVLDGKVIKYQLTGANKDSVGGQIFMFGTYYKFRSAIEQTLAKLEE